MMDEGGGAEAPGLHDHAADASRHLAQEARELHRVIPYARERPGHVLRELLRGSVSLEFGPLDVAAALHLVDEDAEAFGGSCVARARPPSSQVAAVRCSNQAPAVSISAMPAMSISPVNSAVGGIGTRRRLSAKSSSWPRRPSRRRSRSSERRAFELDAEARRAAWVERLRVWSRFSMSRRSNRWRLTMHVDARGRAACF